MKTYTYEEMKAKEPDTAHQAELYSFCRWLEERQKYYEIKSLLEKDKDEGAMAFYLGEKKMTATTIEKLKYHELWAEK